MKAIILYSTIIISFQFLAGNLVAQPLTQEQELEYYKWWENRGKEFGVAKHVFDQMLEDESLVKKDLGKIADGLKAIDIMQKLAQAKDQDAAKAVIQTAGEKLLEKSMPGFNAWLGWISWAKSAMELIDKYYFQPWILKREIDKYIRNREAMSGEDVDLDADNIGYLLEKMWVNKEGYDNNNIRDKNGKLLTPWETRYKQFRRDFLNEHYQKKLELDRLKKQAKEESERMQRQFDRDLRRLLLDYEEELDKQDDENEESGEESNEVQGDKNVGEESNDESGESSEDESNEDENKKPGDEETKSSEPAEEEPKALALVISPSSVTLDINESVSFKVYLVNQDGSTRDVTGEVFSDPVFYPDKVGSHQVVAEYQGLSASASVTVTGCADPNAEFKDGSCKCKDGFTRDENENCASKAEVFTSISLVPPSASTHIGGTVRFNVIGINANGDAVDITSRVYDDPEFYADEAGEFTIAASYQGLSASATITVKECADANAEFDYGSGDCKCKTGFKPGPDGKCEKEKLNYVAVVISPSELNLKLGESASFKVFAIVENTGESVDVTNEALPNPEFKATEKGQFSMRGSFESMSFNASINVEDACPDANMELTADGNCKCKSGFTDDGKGGCKEKEEEEADTDCPDPNMIIKNGDCRCKPGFFPDPDNASRCKSLEETKEEAKEDAEPTDCLTFESIAGKLSSLKIRLLSAMKTFNSHYARFQREINDNKSDPCKNQMLGFSFGRAKAAATTVQEIKQQAMFEATKLMFAEKCPDFEAKRNAAGFGSADIDNLGGQVELLVSDMASMMNSIKEEGCDEDDLDELGQQVAADPNADPELTSDGGTGTEIQGDGKDNDGEGQQDEIPVSAVPGYNVTIVVYDSGSAKDDVFSLSVSDVGYLGITPEGGLFPFPLNLAPKSYIATVTVVSAPDDVGTFTINILYNGVSIGSMTGDPGQGSSQTLNFTIPE